MNNKGQVVFLMFMIAVVIVLLALALSFPVRQGTDNAMTSMNCSTTTNNYTKAGCWAADINPAYFIGGILALAGIVISAKLMLE